MNSSSLTPIGQSDEKSPKHFAGVGDYSAKIATFVIETQMK